MSTALAIPNRKASTRIIQTSTTPVTTEDGEDRGKDHHRDLGGDQDLSLGQGIRGDAGEQPEDDDRDELGGGDDPEPDRIVGDSRTSHACATCCIQVPTSEIAWPPKNSR